MILEVSWMSKKVLIVEDEISIQRILQYDLMQSGFSVDLASDGEEDFKKHFPTNTMSFY